HDLGQTYILIDPTVFTENDFWDRIKRVQTAVNEEENARLPGDSLVYNDPVEIDSTTWARVLELS
ncbi:MAG: Ldh family oxidoreductase, partial [Rhodobacteraceae bacterium]|nr:Ldh family oxidoreductase [Paracoccaceae bacterium]